MLGDRDLTAVISPLPRNTRAKNPHQTETPQPPESLEMPEAPDESEPSESPDSAS